MTPIEIQNALAHPEFVPLEAWRSGRVLSPFEVESLEMDMARDFVERRNHGACPIHLAEQIRASENYISALRSLAQPPSSYVSVVSRIQDTERKRQKEREEFAQGLKQERAAIKYTSGERRMIEKAKSKQKSWRSTPECQTLRSVGIGLVGAACLPSTVGAVICGTLAEAGSRNLCDASKPILTWSDPVCKRTGWPCESDQNTN